MKKNTGWKNRLQIQKLTSLEGFCNPADQSFFCQVLSFKQVCK